MTKNITPTPVYLDPGMHSGLEVKGLTTASDATEIDEIVVVGEATPHRLLKIAGHKQSGTVFSVYGSLDSSQSTNSQSTTSPRILVTSRILIISERHALPFITSIEYT